MDTEANAAAGGDEELTAEERTWQVIVQAANRRIELVESELVHVRARAAEANGEVQRLERVLAELEAELEDLVGRETE